MNMVRDTADYVNIFNAFTKRFLKNKKSIFSLDDDTEILTKESVAYLVENFINNAHSGDASFIDKVKHQLIDKPIDKPKDKQGETIPKDAIEVLATAVWLWRLPPSNSTKKGRQDSVKEILALDDNLNKYALSNDYFNEKIKGFAKPGTLYNTSKPSQLVYIIRFFEKIVQDNNEGYIAILNDNPLKTSEVSVETTTEYSQDQSGKYKANEISPPEERSGQVSMRNALLHLFNPEYYEPILSMNHKGIIIDAFSDKLEKGWEDNDEDVNLASIRQKLSQEDPAITTGDFHRNPKYREKWDPLVLPSKNIIYYGAPGTGKTYQATELVRRKTNADINRYIIQQFHPSFSYEDFIDGVKPDCIGAGGMQFKLVNGVFKALCIKAFEELKKAKKDGRKAKDFYFIADEINRAELSRVFGELLLCLEEDKRLRFNEDGTLLGVKIKTQNSQLWKEEDAVHCEDSEDSDFYFGVPENLYFIGTMNDIDRSIDSFDLALRRRFMWIYKGCDYDVIANALMEKNLKDDAFLEYLGDGKNGDPKGRCLLLNEYISKTLSLGESYELGHSYYMNIDVRNGEIYKAAYERLFDYEMAPLLTEYLRAEYSGGKELKDQLNVMRKLFTSGKVKGEHA